MITAALRYEMAVRVRNRRFGLKAASGKWQTPGDVVEIQTQPRGAVFRTERGAVEVFFLSLEIVRVRLGLNDDFLPPFSYAVDKIDWPAPVLVCEDSAAAFTMRTDQIICRVYKKPCRLVFETIDGMVISEDEGGMSWRGDEVSWTRVLPGDERCYGLGERAWTVNQRGRRLSLWNADPMLFERGVDPVYFSIPFYLGVRPELVCGILWDNPARGVVDLGAAKSKAMKFAAEDGELRYFLMAGTTAQQVLEQYTALTGHMPLPPVWALGFHQSRWGYKSDTEFREVAREFRRRSLPCDVLHFDIDYMDGYRCFTWDRKRFPLLPGLLSELRSQGFKSVAILDPGIKVDSAYPVYQDGVQQDVFLKYPDGARVSGPVWPGNCHFPDFSSARVRAWWADQIPALTQAGFNGLWTDMNEPALLGLRAGSTLPDYVVHDWDGAGRTHVQGGHNLYGMLMARATREGLQKQCPDKRPFVMTRSAYAGAQRYASSWTGDNVASWDHLRLSISMVLNLGLGGMAFTGPDIGGFAGDPDAELYTRWMQLGCLLPYFRAHSTATSTRREPWAFGEQYEGIVRRYLELRYQLLPYIYSTFAQCAQNGTPIARPLFMADPSDSSLYEIDDQFMLGDAILVAPVVERGATERELYLPKGVWYEYWTGKLIDGERSVTAAAPLDLMPVYVRAGKVLPMWPVMQYVGERPITEMRLRAFAGSGETVIYEDAGEGLAYQNGDYRWSYFTNKFLPSGHFAIEWRRAGRYQPPYQQIRVEVVGIPSEPESVDLDGQVAPVWYYEAGIVEFIVKPFGLARIGGRSPSPQAERTLARRPRP